MDKNNKNLIIGIFIILIILGLIAGVKLGGNFLGGKTPEDSLIPPTAETGDITSIPIEPTLTSAPTPTFAPLTDTVKSISADQIIITGKSGDMIVPKNPQMVEVFLKKGNDQVSASFDDVQVGQIVTLKIIVPGKEAQLIIE